MNSLKAINSWLTGFSFVIISLGSPDFCKREREILVRALEASLIRHISLEIKNVLFSLKQTKMLNYLFSSSCSGRGYGYYPHFNDCSKYHVCLPFQLGGFRKWEFSCGPGTVFSKRHKACVHDNGKICSWISGPRRFHIFEGQFWRLRVSCANPFVHSNFRVVFVCMVVDVAQPISMHWMKKPYQSLYEFVRTCSLLCQNKVYPMKMKLGCCAFLIRNSFRKWRTVPRIEGYLGN